MPREMEKYCYTGALALILGFLASAQPSTAAELTANDLNCSGCVDSSDIKDNAANSRSIRNRSVKEQDTLRYANPSRVESHFAPDLRWSGCGKYQPCRVFERELEVKRKGFVVWIASLTYFSEYDQIMRCHIEIPYYKRKIVDSYFDFRSEPGKYTPATAFGVAEIVRLPDGDRKRKLQIRISCEGGYMDDQEEYKSIRNMSLTLFHLPNDYGVEVVD